VGFLDLEEFFMKRWLLCVAIAGAVSATPVEAGAPAKKKLLVITESKGFVHPVVKRGKDDALSLVEKTFIEWGNKSGLFEATVSQDSRKDITAENLKNFDAVWFYTTGELPLSDVQKADLLDFVRSGKGFGGCHSAADTFYKWKEYGELIGAYFAGHPPGYQKIRVIVEDTKHPATKHLGESFAIEDEIYQYKEPYSRKSLNVLMRIDPESHKNVWRKDGDNPLAWTREYGKGRVFYTALGHAEHVWRDQRYQDHVLGGLRFIFFVENPKKAP
jgi:type 1 glutamine amidotransferase